MISSLLVLEGSKKYSQVVWGDSTWLFLQLHYLKVFFYECAQW